MSDKVQKGLKRLMKLMRVNQVGLASVLELSQGTVSQYINGHHKPSKKTMNKIFWICGQNKYRIDWGREYRYMK